MHASIFQAKLPVGLSLGRVDRYYSVPGIFLHPAIAFGIEWMKGGGGMDAQRVEYVCAPFPAWKIRYLFYQRNG